VSTDYGKGLAAFERGARQSPSGLLGFRIAGKYQIVRLLSSGGMASVYEAIDTQSDCRVALKVLHPHHAQRLGVLRRFQLEAQLQQGLDSRYVAVPRDSGCSDGIHYLAMERLVGEDLRQLLRRQGTLSVAQSVDMALDVCRGLASAHARGLIHRDIKPSNIFIARDADGHRRAKLLDFGIAKHSGVPDSTEECGLLGTVEYMAPEQVVASKSASPRSDIYSLGLVLYEALSGAPAHSGERTQVLYEIIHGPPLSLADFASAVPRGLARAIVKAVASDPADRFADAQAFAAALGIYAGNGVFRSGLLETMPGGGSRRVSTDTDEPLVATTVASLDGDSSDGDAVANVQSARALASNRPWARHGIVPAAALGALVAVMALSSKQPSAGNVASINGRFAPRATHRDATQGRGSPQAARAKDASARAGCPNASADSPRDLPPGTLCPEGSVVFLRGARYICGRGGEAYAPAVVWSTSL
jgi:eukaryotic-like serine/threonine-protein kinase